jgi:pyruvate kinase
MTRRSRRVKILATLGPASADPEVVEALFHAGADVFRINMSHASHDMMRERVATIRARGEGRSADRHSRRSAGPETARRRVRQRRRGPAQGRCSRSTTTQARRRHARATAASGNPGIAAARPPPADRRRQGAIARAVALGPATPNASSKWPGKISNKKGVSLPDTTLPTSAMTEKDRADLDAALEENIDWIALSFVQRPEDVAEVKRSPASAPA